MPTGRLFDGGIIIFLLLQTYLGWRRGLLWQAAGVASIFFGVLLGWLLSPLAGAALHEHITSNPFRARLVGFLFVVASVGCALRMLAAWAEVRSEQGLPKPERDRRRADDRILGGIFGALKGCVLALVLVAAAVTCFPDFRAWPQSALVPPLAAAGSRLLPSGAVKEAAQWASRSAAEMQRGLEIK